jgi:hypothetical protein
MAQEGEPRTKEYNVHSKILKNRLIASRFLNCIYYNDTGQNIVNSVFVFKLLTLYGPYSFTF